MSDARLDLGITPTGARAAAVSRFGAVLRSSNTRVSGGKARPPAAPTGLKVTESSPSSVTLYWNKVSGAVAYGVYRDGGPIGGSTLRSVSVGGLACATGYLFEVDAVDAQGRRSARTSVRAATTACAGDGGGGGGGGADTQAPSTPGGLAMLAGTETSISLSWNASSDNVGVVGYGVYRDGTLVASTSGLTSIVADLACGRTYVLAVDAYDAAGNRSAKASVNAATNACPNPADTQPPTSPGALARSGASATTVTVSWTASSDNIGVNGYHVFVNGTAVAALGSEARSYTFAGLACGTAYTLGVEASDAAGNRSVRAVLGTSTSACPSGDTQPPSVPQGMQVPGITGTSISLSWNASTDNVGVAGYRLHRDGALVATVQGLTYTFTGLTCGTSYVVDVQAYDAAGNVSDPAYARTTETTTACGGPTPPASANLFVSPSGSDSNPCTQSQPCGSFQRAYSLAPAGATVELAGGTYGGQTVNASPKSGADVVFRPALGASVTVRSIDIANAAHIEFRDFTVTTSTYNRPGAQWITYRRIAMRQFFIRGADHIRYYDSDVGPNVSDDGMNWIGEAYQTTDPATDIVLEGMRIHDFKKWNAGAHVDCIGIDNVDGIVIRNSRIWNCEHFSLIFGNDITSGRAARNILIENNFLDCCYSGYYSIGLGAIEANMTVRFNSFTLGIGFLGGSVNGLVMDSNVISNNNSANCSRGTWRYNVVASGSPCSGGVTAPTGFVREPDDLHLVASAAAINAGNPSSHPATDIDGEPRPAVDRPDAGADER